MGRHSRGSGNPVLYGSLATASRRGDRVKPEDDIICFGQIYNNNEMTDYIWVVLAFVSAVCLAASDALTKRSLEGDDEYLAAGFRLIFTLPLLVITLIIIPVPQLDAGFYTAFFIALPIEAITVVLYIKALKESPLSLTMPFLALTPVFLILFSYVLLGEKVSLTGGAGIFLIAAGSYLLNINQVKEGLCQPFRAITKEKGAVYMIMVALLYSITSSLGKMAIGHSSPLFFGAVYFVGLNLVYLPYGLTRGGSGGRTGRRASLREYLASGRYRLQIVPGLFYGAMVLTHMAAMNLTKVAYMVSVKRSSLLISILFGYLFFREENIRDRFLGALLMFIGFVAVVGSQ
ncbi:MAG: hypothetical protein C0402_02210 [Thermodesulfovibrio sp.]|nr:hypothetical protein [Thermodesulfovibrio sp.]